MRQLQMDLCMKQIVPRAHLHSLIDNKNDEQYSLRHRVSESSTATKQHVNKRKSKGQVRVFGVCDLNPNLWIKSTPLFFHEERLKSPIHKLIEINKKAMLAFQEPPNEPAATTACCGGNSNNKTFNRDKSQNDAIVHAPNISIETVTLVSDDDSMNGGTDFEAKIMYYKMSQDVNMNENITITSASTAPTVAEEMEDDSPDVIFVEPMHCEDSSENHIDGDNAHQVRELIIENGTQQKAEDEVEPLEAEASRKDEEADRKQNEVDIEQKILDIIDLVEQAESNDFEGPAVIYIESQKYLPTETDGEMVAAPIETGGEMETTQLETDGEMVAAPTETDCGMVATPIENDGELVATPSATNSRNEENSELHCVGQLVWAQLAKFPFWPAIVYPDKENISVKGKNIASDRLSNLLFYY